MTPKVDGIVPGVSKVDGFVPGVSKVDGLGTRSVYKTFFVAAVTDSRRSLSLKLSDTRVYKLQ